jgi:methionine sulfoxide reductase heme-binding subunit
LIPALKTVIWLAALTPACLLVYAMLTGGDLTANPIEYITHQTGWYALLFLTISLSITPLRRLTKWHVLIRFRRLLGLFSFFYATLHLATWFVFDKVFALTGAEGAAIELWHAVVADVVKRPYITMGMATYLMLLPLAVTSTKGMIRRLGGKRWNRLHRLAYVAAITAVIHFWWLVKSDVREPQRWAAVVALLLGVRLWRVYQDTLMERNQRAVGAR